MNKRRAYRAGDIAVISAAAPGSVRVVIERSDRGHVTLIFLMPEDWTVEDQCKEEKERA